MTRKHASDIAAFMRRAIADGEYKFMERLPSSRLLAEQMGVARNTLREALYQLEKERLVETKPGSGTYIIDADTTIPPTAVKDAAPLELIDARFALEPHICRLSVLHARREDFEKMETLCFRMERASGDAIAFAIADTKFHRALVESTRNNLLIWLIDQINTVRSLEEWTRMRHLTLDEPMIKHYNQQHRDILNALRSREPERAASKMKEHLEAARLSLTRAAEA